MDCVILGPTQINKIKLFGKIQNTSVYINEAAKFFADNFRAIIIVPDMGLPLLIAKKYKQLNQSGIVIGYTPDKTSGGKLLAGYYKYCDKIKGINGGWYNLNTQLTRQSEHIFCLGFSAGVLIELCSIKYNQQYLNLNTKIFFDRRCLSHKLLPEIESDINNIYYFNNFKKAGDILRSI